MRNRLILIPMMLLAAASAHAQSSWDFTLTNDPAYCQTCPVVTGSGVLTVSPTLFSSIQGSGYPITSLTGTLNGLPMTLAPVPGGGLGNLFFKPYLPVGWFAPLYFSTPAGSWNISQQDSTHPGTGQILAGPLVAAIAFTVTAVQLPQSFLPASYPFLPEGSQ